MHIILHSPWLLLLIFPTLAVVFGLCRRARFSAARTGLYLLIAAGLVVCMAGPARLPFRDRIPILYLIDHSDSVADFRGELQSVQPLFTGDNAGALDAWSQPQPWWLFGNNLVVNADGGGEQSLQGLVDRTGSRYGVALDVLRRWAADKPAGCAVLIGDGNADDLNAALQQAAQLRRMGWTIDTLASPAPAFDLAVIGVDAPPEVTLEQYAAVRVRLRANAAGVGSLQLTVLDRDDQSVFSDRREIQFAQAGEQDLSFGIRLAALGAYRLIAHCRAGVADAPAASTPPPATALAATLATDAQPANDAGYQMINVTAAELPILHVVDDAHPSALGIQLRHMAATLPDLGWQYTTLTPKRFAALGGVPRKTRLLILDNIAREELNQPTWRAVNQFVQVDGGGLLALGGEQAFGAGGHRPDEEFERCLPIRMEPPKNRRIDIVLIVDTSASMADTIVESAVKSSKLEAAKEAVWGLLGGQSLLGDDDRIALVTFSDEARLRLPFTPIREALTIKQRLATLQPEGATRPAPGVEQAFQLTADSKADKIFYVFVSDGQPSSAGADQLDFASNQNNRIVELLKQTIDAEGRRSFWPIFIGDPQGTEPYRRTLSDFARFGHGRMIWPQSAGNTHPAAGEATTLLEALRAILDAGNRDRFVGKRPFACVAASSSHPLAALLATDGNYPWRNRVGEKPGAELLWQAVEAAAGDAPTPPRPELLGAAGRYGNGRSAAIAMPLNGLMIQGRKTNPRLANQLIDWLAWLTGGGEPSRAWVDVAPADAATAAALGVPAGSPCLQVRLFDPAERNTTALDYTVQPVPFGMEDRLGGDRAVAPPADPPLRWLAPGRFAAPWLRESTQATLYAVQLDAAAAGGDVRRRPLGRVRLARPAGAEYLQSDLNLAALTALATAGGGKLMTARDAPREWRWRVENQWRAGRSARIARDGDDLRPWLAGLLALLVIADTAVRWLRPGATTAPPADAAPGVSA